MKRFKTIDTWTSILLMSSGFIIVLASQDLMWLIRFYFIIGSWQVISMLVHFFTGWFMHKHSSRSIYQWFVCALFIVVLLGFLAPAFWFILYFLLVASPVLAFIYTSICMHEVRILKNEYSVRLK